MNLQRDSGWLQALADLFFPPQCLACSEPLPATFAPLFCRVCLDRLPWITAPLCTCCGTPFQAGASHLCGTCLAKVPAFNLARSVFRYQDPLRSCILALKFQGDLSLLSSLAALCREAAVCTDFSEPDCVVPVPLHPIRLRERGFNQALLLAKSCFPQWQGRIAPQLLLRQEHTPPQTSLGGSARRRNLSGSFVLAGGRRLDGKSVLLIDDVYTTGTTISACAQALQEAGAARIEVFTLARSVIR